MNNVDRIFSETANSTDFVDSYLGYLTQVLAKIDRSEIAAFVDVLLAARQAGSTVYFIGNGGSAATASHFANDISIGTRSFEKPFRAVSLCDNLAVITAIGNDNGYDNIFYEQLAVLLKKDDVVVAISASGNSGNVIRGIEYAKKIGAKTIGLTGFDGGKLRPLVDHTVHIPSEKGEYGPVEDGHMIIDHVVGNYLMRFIK
ncbi:MAG: D-sedoheptulose 7-phosphate isomerase [Candidatus Azotimanducaceae bacterium]|jgi:D-sedoheptulose 7-phosphate isomerase